MGKVKLIRQFRLADPATSSPSRTLGGTTGLSRARPTSGSSGACSTADLSRGGAFHCANSRSKGGSPARRVSALITIAPPELPQSRTITWRHGHFILWRCRDELCPRDAAVHTRWSRHSPFPAPGSESKTTVDQLVSTADRSCATEWYAYKSGSWTFPCSDQHQRL